MANQPEAQHQRVAVTALGPEASVLNASSVFTRVDALRSHLTLPIARVPLVPDVKEYATARDAYELQLDTIAIFFRAVTSGDEAVVSSLVTSSIVSPNIISPDGETPLLTAVRLGNTSMIRHLCSRGAAVNRLGFPLSPHGTLQDPRRRPERTPLQLAASLGNLVVVRLLVEEYGADDALLATDGAFAVNLAAANGHADVVAYLPPRDGGRGMRLKEQLRLRERLGRLWEAVSHVVIMICLGIYLLPKEAVLSTSRTIRGNRQKT